MKGQAMDTMILLAIAIAGVAAVFLFIDSSNVKGPK